MTDWKQFSAEAPDLAAATVAKFESHLHHVLATLRRDGSPRVSGTEVRFFEGEAILGCMPGSRKGADMRRDPRVAVHAATTDVELVAGDFKVSGVAVEITDRDEVARFLQSLGTPDEAADADGPVDSDAFRLELRDVTRTRVDGDHLVIDVWRPGRPVETISRK